MELKMEKNSIMKSSERLLELEAGMFSDNIYRNKYISIFTSRSFVENPLLYFKVFRFNKDVYDTDGQNAWLPENNKMCRISMIEPKYLGYEYEDLILTKKELKDIIEYFKTPLDTILEEYKGWTNWRLLIETSNDEYSMVGNIRPIPEDLPMPDYTLLPTMG